MQHTLQTARASHWEEVRVYLLLTTYYLPLTPYYLLHYSLLITYYGRCGTSFEACRRDRSKACPPPGGPIGSRKCFRHHASRGYKPTLDEQVVAQVGSVLLLVTTYYLLPTTYLQAHPRRTGYSASRQIYRGRQDSLP